MGRCVIVEVDVLVHVVGNVDGVVVAEEGFELWIRIGSILEVALDRVVEFAGKTTRLFVA